MDHNLIAEKLKAIVSDYTQEQQALDHLDENTDFIADLKINSANLVDIVLDIEEQFAITIGNDDMNRMLNVRDTIQVIQSKLTSDAG